MPNTFYAVGKANDPKQRRGYIVHDDGLHESINAPGFEKALNYNANYRFPARPVRVGGPAPASQ